MKPTELEAQLERLHPESFGWALHCCGRDETEAEDVLQSAYLRLVSGRARYQGRSSFKTWLFGVIRRTAQEHRRRSRMRRERIIRLVPEGPEDKRAPDPLGELEREERTRRLLRALEELSPRQREILHLVFYQDLTIEEGAEVMGVSLGSARTHYQRGKDRLRILLRQDQQNDQSSIGF
jgi:RNA polymerase sigma-70 factor (ECF subfamily)